MTIISLSLGFSELERSELIQKTVGISKVALIPSTAASSGDNGQGAEDGNSHKQVIDAFQDNLTLRKTLIGAQLRKRIVL